MSKATFLMILNSLDAYDLLDILLQHAHIRGDAECIEAAILHNKQLATGVDNA